MKNKILKFSKGDFQLLKPNIEFEETNLILIIGEGEIYRGDFTVKTEENRSIRGLIYTSSYRMKFKNPGFEGNPAKVEFYYDGRGLMPGYVEKGTITVVCDGGEYDLAFTAIIEKPYVQTTYGKVQNTDDFRRLAIKDFNEAVRLFRSRAFYNILKYENERVFYLYDNIRKWDLNDQAMEEFLVGIKQKECIFLTLPGEGMLFEDLTESAKGTLTLVKNTWGFMPIKVETEGAFIRITRPNISTDDFIGNSYEYEYFVQPEELHAGRNFGTIKFITPYETLVYEIDVLQPCDYDENHRDETLLKAQLLKEFISYTAGRIGQDHWLESASDKMKSLCNIDPNNDFYQLLQANIFVFGQKYEEAKWILENYNYSRFASVKNPVNNAYYMFLSALVRGKGPHTERALTDIYKTISQHPDNWLLLYMAMTLDARLKSPYRRLDLLEEYFEYGTREVLFYLEVFRCYKEKLTLLRKLGNLELQVLNFATKYHLMTREMALYVANLASQQKKFDQSLYRILVRLYEEFQDALILNAICTLLIKGDKTGKKYFPFYKRAVEQDLKIALLYEFYMYSIDENDVTEPLPKKILLYFMHGNSLNYRKKAVLFANLVTYENRSGELYLGYREQMAQFTWEQLLKRHISESLKVLYKRFVKEDELNEERAEALRDICYSYSITTRVKHMNAVLVIEKDGVIRQKVRYNPEEGAVIRLYDKESRIVWEALDGRHYTDSIVYETKRLFYEPRFLELCEDYEESIAGAHPEDVRSIPTVEGVKSYGIQAFDLDDVFELCKMRIKEHEYGEDSFALTLAYKLYEKKYYDEETLAYLAEYYCGPTANMKRIWKTLETHNMSRNKIGERIITQSIFSEHILGEEQIFADYYLSDSVYFRLKQAYLAYVSREYVVYDRALDSSVFEIIAFECNKGEDLADVCKIALLKYYSNHIYPESYLDVLHRVMREMCEKQLIFPYYLAYSEEWLREFQLYDKTMILYKAKAGSRVKLFYKSNLSDSEDAVYQSEAMLPVFENFYLKQFILYGDESVSYYIQEISDRENKNSEKQILENERNIEAYGKYGRLNRMIQMSEGTERSDMIRNYAIETMFADKFFKTY